MSNIFRTLVYVICIFQSTTVLCHQLSTSYLTLNTQKEGSDTKQLTGNWQIELADLEQEMAFDLNNDGNISWFEITNKRSLINDFTSSNITVSLPSGQTCAFDSTAPLQLDTHYNQPYVVVPLSFACPINNDVIVNYHAFLDIDTNHKAIVNINSQTRVFSDRNQIQTFEFSSPSYLATFTQYVYQGVLHIWLGLDHILFLVALLLTCVLVRDDNKWRGMRSKLAIFKQTAWIVTAFTLAHSITLTATAMHLLSPSSRWVELGIAISVLFAALNNIWPLILRLGWVTFCFGLLHGMGFASVLGELGLSSHYQLLSVLAFNLGVEIGQLVILAVTLPMLILIRNYGWYQKWVMPAGSLAIALIAVQWSIERI